MAKVKLLVDTDVLIDFLNTGFLSSLFEDQGFEIYYSVVTKKELLSKRGLRESERKAIALMLEDFRVVPLNPWITERYSKLRREHPSLEKEDALIAATALTRKLPLLTRNSKHFQSVDGLKLFGGRGGSSRRAASKRSPRT